MIPALMLAAALSVPLTHPDPAETPGLARTDLTVQAICSTRWGHDERHVTEEMKLEVFKAYGFSGPNDPTCALDAHGKRWEVDHLISREISGADDVRNLWPECYAGPWNAHDKDRVENRVHVELCAGRLTLEEAQHALTDDWQATYVRYFGQPPAP